MKLFIQLLLILTLTSVLTAEDVYKLSYTMSSGGYPFGSTVSTRKIVDVNGNKMSEDNLVSAMRPGTGSDATTSRSDETVTTNKGAIHSYKASFTSDGQITTVNATVEGDKIIVRGKVSEGDIGVWQDFKLKDFDYTTSSLRTKIIDNLKKGINKLKILNFYEVTIFDAVLEFLGTEKIKVSGKELECKKVKFDIQTVKGTMWLAKDECGYFLVKEKATSEDGPFELTLTEYKKEGEGESEESGSDFGF